MQLFCIFQNRERTGHSLISTSGVDNDRKLTAIHSCIRSGSSASFCACADVVAVSIKKYSSNICTVISGESFIGDCAVILNLTGQDFTDIVDVSHINKIPDRLYIQKSTVSQSFFACTFNWYIVKDFSIFFNSYNVCMIVGNTDFSRILSGKYFNDDVEDTAVINMLDGNLSFFEILCHFFCLCFCYIRDNFQFFRSISGNDSGCSSGRDSF